LDAVGTRRIGMAANKKIGTLLVREGRITAEEVRSALRSQELTGKRLGDVLIERGIVSRPELARALARQQGVQLVEEPGFGSGLRAALERAHQAKRGTVSSAAQSVA
jgi:hypothetical protein